MKHSGFILLLFSLVMFGACKSSKKGKVVYKQVNLHADSLNIVGDGTTDNTATFQKLFDQYKNLNLELPKDQIYKTKSLVISDGQSISINGNGSTLQLSDRSKYGYLLELIDLDRIHLQNLNFKGIEKSDVHAEYLVQIVSSGSNTEIIQIDSCMLQDHNGGGIIFTNIFSEVDRRKDYRAGAEKIIVKNSSVINIGNNSNVQFRGSHRNIEVDGLYASDPNGTQKKGALLGFSAEVSQRKDEMGTVRVKNSVFEKFNRSAIFLQKVNDALIENITIREAGFQPNLYKNKSKQGITIVKCDDLGIENKAVFKNITVENSYDKTYTVFFSAEESARIGHTSGVVIDGFTTDAGMRLGASGQHIIKNGTMTGGFISLVSEQNTLDGIQFKYKERTEALKVLSSNNEIKNVISENGFINIYPKRKGILFENCHLKTKGQDYFMILDANDPQDPNEISLVNCSAPPGTLGIKSGGGPQKAFNIQIKMDDATRQNFKMHKYLQERVRPEIIK